MEALALDKIPPQSLEAEQSVLGAMMLDREATAVGVEMLKPDDFYRGLHQQIFRAIQILFDKNEPVDLITLTEELRRRGELDQVGGPAYLNALVNSVPTAANIQNYANLVAQKSLLRNLIAAASEISQWAYQEEEDARTIADKSEQRVFEVAERRITRGFSELGPLVTEAFEKIDRHYHHPGEILGLPTGLIDFDRMTTGLHPSNLIVLAARPSMGKTSLAMNVAAYVATLPQPRQVGIFSLEMSKEQLVEGMLCAEAHVDGHRLRTGRIAPSEWEKIGLALNRLYQAPIFIDDSPGITPMEMRAKARRLKAERGLDLLIVDYLQLVNPGGRFDNRHQELSSIIRSLKAMARDLTVPVLVLSQLSRQVERREEKRPILSDLAESGSIEAEADLVAFIYRAAYYEYRKAGGDTGVEPDVDDTAELIIAKHRNGPTGTVEVVFLRRHRRFENRETHRRPEMENDKMTE